MEEWKEYKLGELSKDKGCYGIAASAVPYSPYLHTYLRITDINDDGTLNKTGLMSVSEDNVEKYILKRNDIVFARTGNSTGRTYFYDGNDGELVYAGFLIKFSLDASKVNPRILKYYTHSKLYYDWVNSFDTGGTRGNINARTYSEMPIILPPRAIQDKIVSILKSLDDKIEVNRRINDNLEQQAQALFKSWFVDFEPFKDGEFVDSELGRIPKGWKVVSLSSIADYINGLAMQKYRPTDGESGLPVLKIKELRQGRTDDSSELCSPSLIGSKYIIDDGDIIFSWSGTLMVKVWCGGKCGLNQHLFVVEPKDYPRWFAYQWTKHHLANFIHIAKDKAVTMGHIKRGELDKAKVVVPDETNMVAIDLLMKPLHNQIISNMKEARRLTSLRDTLIPRLMSGELKINK
jgi:type I restriction enzyme S subunit